MYSDSLKNERNSYSPEKTEIYTVLISFSKWGKFAISVERDLTHTYQDW